MRDPTDEYDEIELLKNTIGIGNEMIKSQQNEISDLKTELLKIYRELYKK